MSGDTTSDLIGQRPQRDAGVPHFYLACRRCGGAVRPGRLRCSQCSSDELAGQQSQDLPVTKGLSTSLLRGGSANQFSIETLLLVTTLAASCVALCAAVAPVGLIVSFIALVALVRTLIAGRQKGRAVVAFPIREKIEEFVTSCVISVYALLCCGLVALGAYGFGWFVEGLAELSLVHLADFTQSAARQTAAFIVNPLSWFAVTVLSPAAGIWFLWTTRPP